MSWSESDQRRLRSTTRIPSDLTRTDLDEQREHMMVIIEQGRTKRRLRGAFNLCGSREDVQRLVDQLSAHLADPSWSYGWTRIMSAQPSITNTPPQEWE
jgi:hypothetical protein